MGAASNFAENVGSFLHLPEWGLSEKWNKNRPTAKTGVSPSSSAYWGKHLTQLSDNSPGRLRSTNTGNAYVMPNGAVVPLGGGGAGTVDGATTNSGYTQEDFDNAVNAAVKEALAASGGGGTETKDRLVQATPNGQLYNINDPAQREAYFNERNQYAQSLLGKYSTGQQNNLNLALQQAKNEAGDYQKQYQADQTLEDTAWQQYLNDFAYNQQQLDTQYGQGESARMGKYTSLSPNAYQSSMGTSGQYALKQLNTGKERQESQKTAEASNKAVREQRRKDSIESLNQYYNLYEQQQRAAFQQAVNEYKQTVEQQAMDEAASFASADANAGIYGAYDRNKYGYNALSDWKPEQANTSDLIPDISFGTGTSSGAASSGNTASSTGSNLLTQAAQSTPSIPALDQYQGLTATSKEKDPLQTWLY